LVHMAVIEVLIRHGNDDVIDAMAKVLEDPNTLGRLNALSVLAGIKSEESMSMIVSVLGDQNSNVRRRAAEVLAGSHTLLVFQLLKRCIKSENWNLKQGAIKTLGMIATDEALDLLEQLLKSGNSAVKLAVLESLASIGNNRCVRLITENLSLPELGEEVLKIIKSLDPDQAITQLISFLTEQAYFKQVVSALASLDRSKVLRYLATKVGMGTPMQQLKSVEALGELGGAEAELYLKKLLEGAFSLDIKTAIHKSIDRIQRRLR
jgi:HEAT repeat protein